MIANNGTIWIATFGVRPENVGPFRCQCCAAVMKESFTPWHWYAERVRCWRCGTPHTFTANEHGCKVEYVATPKGSQMAHNQMISDTSSRMDGASRIG